MNSISITYTLKWQLDFADSYKFTKDGKCFNVKSGKQIKKVYNNGSIGYSINGKFMSLKQLRPHIEKIPPKKILPF